MRMPFGLHNAAQTFQQFIQQVLCGLLFCHAHIDDMLIASATLDKHKKHLHMTLDCLKEYSIHTPKQICTWTSQLKFFVDSQGIHSLEEKVYKSMHCQ